MSDTCDNCESLERDIDTLREELRVSEEEKEKYKDFISDLSYDATQILK